MTTPVASVSPRPRANAARLHTVDFEGPAGRLEALLNHGSASATFAAVVCHPHPKGGGTLHNKVVYRAMKVLNAPQWGFSAPVLRFNFRGTGLSQGEHHGRAESGEVLAALGWLEREYNLPLVGVGFSFGAAMVLKAAAEKPQGLRAIAALGLPTHAGDRVYRYSFLHQLALPKLFLSGGNDQFAPSAELQQLFEAAIEPKQLVLVPGADHFFTGRLDAFEHALATWLEEHAP